MVTATAREPAADRAAGRHWVVTPRFVLRVAGLPVDVLDGLANPRAVRWADRVLAVEAELDRGRDAVVDALRKAVADNDDEHERRELLRLRRGVFNGRPPRDAAAARVLAERLAGEDRDVVLRWLDRRAAYDREIGLGAAVLAEEVGPAREHLRRVARDPRLRHGLLLSSPSLDRYLSGYLDAAAGPLTKRARRIERSVLEYVYRTACKTSPFSTFTAVVIGRFAATGTTLPSVDVDVEWRGHPRLNLAALARLAEAVVDDPRLRADLPVRLTSGLRADEERVRYVRRTRSIGGDDTPMALDFVREKLFYLNRGTVLREVVRVLDERGEMTLGELAARLHAADRSPDDVTRYLRHLLRLGLLTVPALHVDIHSHDPVGAFREALAALGTPWARSTADRLGDVSALVDRYRDADLDARRDLLDDIRAGVDRAQRDLGAAEPNTPRTLVYEDVSVPGAEAVVGLAGWQRSLLPSLRRVARLLPVFDITLPQRLSLRGFFTARFGVGGRCDDVLRFVHEFHRDYFEQYLKVSARPAVDENGAFVPGPNWLRLPDVTAVADARRELIRAMKPAVGSDTDVVLADELVDGIADLVPDHLLDFEPRSFFLQLGTRGDRPFAVVNRTYSGLTLLFSRFVHCFDDGERTGLAAELRAELARLQPVGAVFAELTGGYDTTNLNVHPAVTPYELVCPGDVSFRPAAERIAVDELSVLHDERTGRLRLHSWRLDREVIPVYLGFIIPPALPEVQRAMLLFSRNILARIDLWSGARPPGRGPGVRRLPRVRVGDVVVARRSWTAHPDCLPGGGTGGAENFLDWQRWRRDNGLPRRVFATLGPLVPDRDGAGDPVTVKPQFVDFDSCFSTQLLEKLAQARNQLVVLEEMLPDVEHVWQRSARGRHVTELTVEMTGTTRPLTGY